jgi:cytochrome b561
MYAQIFLGIAIIIKGILHWINSSIVISNKVKQVIRGHQMKEYQGRVALSHFLLGILFISMSVLENMKILQTPLFIAIYIVLGAIPLGMVLIYNKKYSGYYFFL